ncbi:MAG: hypothetical protein WC777_04470 [Candidatus Gracilibacteria bacterium]|jgi:hypothetical protein
MNYKISTGIFATTTLVFAIAFGVSLTMLQKQPNMGPGGFPGGEFEMPPLGEGGFPGQQLCECPEENAENDENDETQEAL